MLNRRQWLQASGGAMAGFLPAFALPAWAQTARNAYSLHIGVNRTNPAAYPGGISDLNGCVSDAEAYKKIAIQAGFRKSHLMTDSKATIGEVARYIHYAADHIRSGDLFFVSYAGHGASVRDASGDEPDGRDETWCLYDGLLLDDYLYSLWARFDAGVRLLVISDSCHSGSVARVQAAARAMNRALSRGGSQSRSLAPRGGDERKATERYVQRLEQLGNIEVEHPTSDLRPRAISDQQAAEAYRYRARDYRAQQEVANNRPGDVRASGILLAACQDHQVSWENSVGRQGGLFTKAVEKAFVNRNNYAGYSIWQQHIASQIGESQTPNFFAFGHEDADFFNQVPFTI